MSLINDALKEAQRERVERVGGGRREAAAIADNFFPYPANRRSRSGGRSASLIASAFLVAALVVVAGSVALIRIRSSGLSWVTKAFTVTRNSMPVARSARAPTPAPISVQVDTANAAVAPAAKPIPAVAPRRGMTTRSATNATAKSPSVLDSSSVRAAAPAAAARVASSATQRVESQGFAIPPSTGGVRVVMQPSNSHSGDSLFAQAYTEHRRGNLDRAAELYEKAIQAKQASPELYNDYGALLAARGNYTGAIAMYRMGLDRDAGSAILWANLADAYNGTGRHADALSAYDEAGRLDPSNAKVKVRLASEYQAIGDTAGARRQYEAAVALAPDDAGVHYAFGAFLQGERDIRGAVREYQLFVDMAQGQYPDATVDEIKAHITSLRKYYHE